MRWLLWWHRQPNGEPARQARQSAEQAVQRERARLVEATELGRRLAAHRERNRFAESMREAFGGQR